MTKVDPHVPFEDGPLVQYWLGELDAAREGEIEEHLLRCTACAGRLEHIVAIAGGIRDLVRTGEVFAVVTDAFVQRLAAHGVRLNQYRVGWNGSVHCSVAPDDEIAIVRLEAPLEGVERLDVLFDVSNGVPHTRLQDVPFDRAAGEVVVTPRIARLRALPVSTAIVRLVSIEPDGERVVGEYRFNHRPWSA